MAKLLPRYNQLSSIKFDQTYQLEMLKTVTKTTRVAPSLKKAVLHWNIPLNFSTLTHALFLWVLWRFPPYLRRIFRFLHPFHFGTHTCPLGTFSTPTPIGTPTFHLEHPSQVQTAVMWWNFKLMFYSASLSFSTLKLHFVDPNL